MVHLGARHGVHVAWVSQTFLSIFNGYKSLAAGRRDMKCDMKCYRAYCVRRPKAANVRRRAERRVGESLKDLARADHADADRASGVVRAANASPKDTRSISQARAADRHTEQP